MRGHAHGGQHGDVDLRVSEEPEQMLPEQGRAAGMIHRLAAHQQASGDKEVGSGMAVEQEHNHRRGENAEREQAQDRCNKP